MSALLDLDDWLETIDKEYLRDFLLQGGAAVKFAVGSEGLASADIGARLEALARLHRARAAG